MRKRKVPAEELEKFESILNWKENLKSNSRSGRLSPNTWDGCLTSMGQLLESLNFSVTPDELRDEGLQNFKKAKARISDFYAWLIDKEGLSESSAKQKAYSRIRGFYSHNEVRFGKWRTPKTGEVKVKAIDELHPVYK